MQFIIPLVFFKNYFIFTESYQAPRFITQPTSTKNVIGEGQTKIIQCQALGKFLKITNTYTYLLFKVYKILILLAQKMYEIYMEIYTYK